MPTSIVRRPLLHMASPHSGMTISRRSPMNSGKREAAHKARRKTIGSMQRKNCDLALTRADPMLADGCPKCGVEMEAIGIGVEGPPIQQLQLCPGCYLVTWSDHDGLHVRQGVPVKKRVIAPAKPSWLVGDPKEC